MESLHMSSCSVPLFEDKDSQDGMPNLCCGKPHQDERPVPRWKHHGIRLLLLIVYSLTLLALPALWTSSSLNAFSTYSPARQVVKLHKVAFDGSLGLRSLYTGKPRPEAEAAWRRLLKHYNLRFTADEMRRLNRTALELRNGGGYYGQLSVHHHLHCLKMLRRVLWHDFYNVSITDIRSHADHCVEDIRQSLMCHADLSVVTFDWQEHRRKPWPNFHIDQTCVDWDGIDAWAAERSFSIFDQKTLVHPKLGLSFPMLDGKIEIQEDSHHDGHHVHPVWPQDIQ
ncbi:hypothetical protein CDD81_5243 [Ophiocordyceps australis]|uniref:Tat pathway signal sequence n=1 Tax=Ophiocordyceps australis TaxID=1399860 RepID=A0A2C5YJ15_9HYPO|nr:hypothetical protein CDD81_5243 [Ophiocordyceps australis]